MPHALGFAAERSVLRAPVQGEEEEWFEQ